MKSTIPIMEIISNSIKVVVKVFDNAYHQGWMLYFIVGIVMLFVFIVFYN